MAYPFGVLGMILAVFAARRLWRPHDPERAGDDELVNLTVRVTQPAVPGRTVAAIMREQGWPVVLSRVRRGEEAVVPRSDFLLRSGDLLVVVGRVGDAEGVVRALGERATEDLPLDRSELDMRRMFVSASEPVGQRIGDLRLLERFGAIVTRVRRGDVDRLARPDTVLEPATDPRLRASFHANDLAGKAAWKAALQAEDGLPVRPDVPLLAVIARLGRKRASTSLPMRSTRSSRGTCRWSSWDPATRRRRRSSFRVPAPGATGCARGSRSTTRARTASRPPRTSS